MRIALLTGSFLPSVGGLEWKVHYLAREYTRLGHEVTVFAPHPIRALRKTALQVLPEYRLIRAGSTGRGQGVLGIQDLMMNRALSTEHRRGPIDVVHCHHIGRPASWGVCLKQRFGVPVVGTTCGDDVFAVPEINYGVRLVPRYDRMIRRNLQYLDVVGAISRAVRAELELLGTKSRIVDIPNGVSWSEFQIPRGRLLRDKLNIPDDELIILSVGRNLNCKRYDLGLKAFSLVAARRPFVHYVIVGRGLESLAGLAVNEGIQSRVHMIAELPMTELAQAFRSADIFFNPSMREGFAQVNAQALASGIPLVVTDAPGNHDAADHGGAVVARSEDVESMAEQLLLLSNDGELRNRLGAQAHDAGKYYSWSNIAKQYLGIFAELNCR